jgi:hypothetical protein
VGASWLDDLTRELQTWLPAEAARAVVAGAIVVLGLLLAWLLGALVARLFRRVSGELVRLTHGGQGATRAPEGVARAEAATVRVARRIVFWLVLSLFLGVATSIMGLPIVSTWLQALAGYLPRVLAAAAIMLLGVLFGHLVRVTVSAAAARSGMAQSRTLGRAAQLALLGVAAVVAIEELGIRITFLMVVAAVVLGAVLGGAALAFGLGARDSVRNLLACHYLSKWYRVGQVVRIGEHQGRIAAVLPAAVILHTEAGRVHVPAHEFMDKVSLLTSDEGPA